jgi:hypothetical protein
MSTTPVVQVARPGSRFQGLFDECCKGISDSALDRVCKDLQTEDWKHTKKWALRCFTHGKLRGWSDQSYRTRHIGFTWRYEYDKVNGDHKITEVSQIN